MDLPSQRQNLQIIYQTYGDNWKNIVVLDDINTSEPSVPTEPSRQVEPSRQDKPSRQDDPSRQDESPRPTQPIISSVSPILERARNDLPLIGSQTLNEIRSIAKMVEVSQGKWHYYIRTAEGPILSDDFGNSPQILASMIYNRFQDDWKTNISRNLGKNSNR
jgi:hypothetical protein